MYLIRITSLKVLTGIHLPKLLSPSILKNPGCTIRFFLRFHPWFSYSPCSCKNVKAICWHAIKASPVGQQGTGLTSLFFPEALINLEHFYHIFLVVMSQFRNKARHLLKQHFMTASQPGHLMTGTWGWEFLINSSTQLAPHCYQTPKWVQIGCPPPHRVHHTRIRAAKTPHSPHNLSSFPPHPRPLQALLTRLTAALSPAPGHAGSCSPSSPRPAEPPARLGLQLPWGRACPPPFCVGVRARVALRGLWGPRGVWGARLVPAACPR